MKTKLMILGIAAFVVIAGCQKKESAASPQTVQPQAAQPQAVQSQNNANTRNTQSQAAEAQSPVPDVQPAAEEQQAGIQGKIASYLRKALSIPPNVKILVGEIRSSEISGLNKASVELSLGERKQSLDILVSKNGKYVIVGGGLKILDITKDPFKETWSKITLKGSPVRGTANAKVTVVEFTDFECPYCGRAYSTVEDLLLKYAGKIKLVYKSYPLPMHPWAMTAAVGAFCAYEQNHDAFWYFYDHLYQEQGAITPDNVKDKLKGYAKATKLSMGKFDTCLDKEQTKPMVERDKKEAESIGVSATPTFVINGRVIQGAQPEEEFVRIINGLLK